MIDKLERFKVAANDLFVRMYQSDKEKFLARKCIFLTHEPTPFRFVSGNYNALRSDMYLMAFISNKDYIDQVEETGLSLRFAFHRENLTRKQYFELLPYFEFAAIYNPEEDKMSIEKGNGFPIITGSVEDFEKLISSFSVKSYKCECGAESIGRHTKEGHSSYCPMSELPKETV